MTCKQFDLIILICWLVSYLMYVGVCLMQYWESIEMAPIRPDIFFFSALSLVLAVLVGVLTIRLGKIGMLYGLTLFVLGITVMKLIGG